jgi:aminoglycoside/choline kinase family phosphotransferase
MTDRAALKEAFLRRIGWADADRAHLAGDASARSYLRLRQGAQTAVLMDNPPGIADTVDDFLRIAAHLSGLGLSAPRIHEADAENGFVLMEDLGDALFTRVVAEDPAMELPLYESAIDVLLTAQSAAPPSRLDALSASDWAAAAGLAPQFYAAGATGRVPDAAAFTAALAAALTELADGPRVLILRDYHAGNLLWLPDRTGVARVGVLDFQQAQLGQPGYDLVSLLQDARRDVSAATETAGLRRFSAALGISSADLAPAYAALGAQRALRILGIFARLCTVGGKAGYVPLIPRVWGQLMRNLAHPALADLRRECLAILPEPDPQTLNRISATCSTLPSP